MANWAGTSPVAQPWGLRDEKGQRWASGLGNCKDGPVNLGSVQIKIWVEGKLRGTAVNSLIPL